MEIIMWRGSQQHKLKSNYERQIFICDVARLARERSQTKWDVSLIKDNKLDILIKIKIMAILIPLHSTLLYTTLHLISAGN